MFNKRVLTGLVIGFTALFAVLHGGLPLAAMVLIIVILASKEYTEIFKHKGFLPSFKIIMISSILFTLIAYYNRFDLVPLAFTVAALASFMWVLFRGKQPYVANVATTILGVVYCGWFPIHLIFLRDLGTYGYALMILFGVVLTDTMCYYVGCQYGKHKLSPVISPNKTIEGSIGGAVFCIGSVLFWGWAMQLPWYHSLMLGVLIAGFAQIGDLCESMIKRDAGVKDSSNILPGHGGFLDRCDSYILTIPVVYYYVYFFIQNNFIDVLKGMF